MSSLTIGVKMPNREDETQRNYYYDGHPPFCTCADCFHKRLVEKGIEKYCGTHNVYYKSCSEQGCPECDREFAENLTSGKVNLPDVKKEVRKPLWDILNQTDNTQDNTSDSDTDNEPKNTILICPKCLEKSMKFDTKRNLYCCQRLNCQATYFDFNEVRKAWRES
jgi:hypothetical protein